MNSLRKLMGAIFMWGTLAFALSLAAPTAAQTWTEITPAGGPTGIELHGYSSTNIAHYDPASNRLIVFLPRSYGFGEPGISPNQTSDVWLLTHANGLGGTPVWMKLAPSGTPPAIHNTPSVVYDASTNRLFVYGGGFFHTSPALSGVFVLTNANGLGGTPVWTQVSVTNPQARIEHSAVYDPQGNRMIAFGGHFAFWGTDQNDARVLINADGTGGPSTWTTLSPSGPAPGARGHHTAVYDQAHNRMTLFGGQHLVSLSPCCTLPLYNDVWVLAGANGSEGTPSWIQQTPDGTPPPPRGYHSAVYDPVANRMIVFGGAAWDQAAQNYTQLADLWQLSNANGLGGTPAWTQLSQTGTPPGPNSAHGAAFDAAHQRMIVFGGYNQSTPHSRVWVLELASPGCIAPPAGMVSWWTADGAANDILGSNHGTQHDGATFASGKVDGAFSFDGAGSYVEVPDSPNLRLTGEITVDFWVYPVQHVVSGIVTKVDNELQGAGWHFGYYGSNLPPGVDPQHVAFTINESFTSYASLSAPANSVPFDAWTHVAATSDGTTMRLYINGMQVDSAAPPSLLASTFTTLMGAYQRNGIKEQFFKGLVDEVEIFNRALSASEIQAIYHAGSAGKCRPSNRTPVADAGADQTVECAGALTPVTLDGAASTDPDGDALGYDWSEGSTPLGTGAILSTGLSFGSHTITLTVTDPGGAAATDTVVVNVVDTVAPDVAAPPDVTVYTGAGAASCSAFVADATLGSATAADGCSSVTVTRSGVPAGNLFPVGATVITWTATDAAGNTSTTSQTISVVDSSPPSITEATVDKPVLWSPNHRMELVTVSYTAADNCGVAHTALSVTSSEPGDGSGDGDTSPDWEIVGAHQVRLRAERSGKGYGRTYTITVTVTDIHGNSSSRTLTVSVPKSRS